MGITGIPLTAPMLAVLEYAARPNASMTATHWYRTHMATPGATTHQAYHLLRKLAKLGLMEGVRAPDGGRIYWWRITEAGRALTP